MPVDRYTGEFIYHNEYEVKDFYIRFPHYEKNQLFTPGHPQFDQCPLYKKSA